MPKFTWNKLGHLFDPSQSRNPAWMHCFAQSPSVLIFDEYLRIYFCTRPPIDNRGQFVSRIGFIDVDRNDLFRIRRISPQPVISLGDLGTFDEFGTHPLSVIRNGDEIRVYYAGITRCESVPFNGAIGLALSDDEGESFQRIGPGPVLSYTPDEPFVLGSPKIRFFGNKWHLHYACGRTWLQSQKRPEPVYKIRSATSDDGIKWNKVGCDIIDSHLEENECQAAADIFRFADRYHMFFSYRYSLGFKCKAKGYRIGYAVSDDLLHWVRHDESVGINVSVDGWDSEMVSYSHVFELDGSVFMLYQGNDFGRCGFGLAVMESYQP